MKFAPRWCALLALATPAAAGAQQYIGRVDVWMQEASFRGVAKDSIPAGAVVTGSTGGYQTPDGYAVSCVPGQPQCYYFRAGSVLTGGPLVTGVDITAWGFGVKGLSAHATARVGMDVGASDVWPGTSPAFQLIEGYVQYATEAATGRLGRQVESGRLGYYGYDGARLAYRFPKEGLTAIGYAGLGLARGVALPITEGSLDPLGDFQPPMRQLLAGAALEWQDRIANARFDYEREVDRDTKNLVSERMALSATIRPWLGWSLSGGADYDLARDLWGSADLTLRQARPTWGTSLGVRRYAPYFDLWSIWGVFSPVPYTAVNGAVWAAPVKGLSLRAGGERYWYANAQAETPLVAEQTEGWRWNVGAGYAFNPKVSIDAGYHVEFGPGASFSGVEGSVIVAPWSMLTFTVQGGYMVRPLEYRVEEPALNWFGLAAEYRATQRLRFGVWAARLNEDRRRPDAASIDWSQTRVALTMSWLLGTNTDYLPLPRAVPREGRQ